VKLGSAVGELPLWVTAQATSAMTTAAATPMLM
jgi:hypothetical protein